MTSLKSEDGCTSSPCSPSGAAIGRRCPGGCCCRSQGALVRVDDMERQGLVKPILTAYIRVADLVVAGMNT